MNDDYKLRFQYCRPLEMNGHWFGLEQCANLESAWRIRMFNRFNWASTCLSLAMTVLLVAVVAGNPTSGTPATAFPWDISKQRSYQYAPPASGVIPTVPPPNAIHRSPSVSTLSITIHPPKHTNEDPNVAYLVAHLPSEAEVWVMDQKTVSKGNLRTYITPSLVSGFEYAYTVRVRWLENGEWVSQMANFRVRAGDTHCIDIIHANTPALEKEIEAAFAKLPADEAASAKKQRNCAVQDGVRLGTMGAPTKIMLKGEAVFLCCRACEEAAKADPDKVLQTAKKLREKDGK